jgi:hypothetical protein
MDGRAGSRVDRSRTSVRWRLASGGHGVWWVAFGREPQKLEMDGFPMRGNQAARWCAGADRLTGACDV